MTPREPDRYDKLAETLFSGAMYPSPGQIAAALRQAADEALERAYTKVNDLIAEFGENPASALSIVSVYVDEALHGILRRRALASPAAAPATGICGYSANGFGPCVLPRDHAGTHGGASEWAKQQGYAPPSGPVAPEKKPFACGADMESDGHLYRCDRGAGHTGSHGERDYAEWTDAEHHDGAPAAPSLLLRVLAALEQEARAKDLQGLPALYRELAALAAELRQYIASTAARSGEGEGK